MTLVTLGRLGIESSGRADASKLLRQPKRLALLVYVLLSQRGGSRSREEVTGVFWPESDSARARNALRQAVSFLRGCLGDHSVSSIGSHGLAVSDAVGCDAVRFEALLDANRKEDALKLYGGEFLPGFHIDGSNGFSDWIDAKRQHFQQRAAKAAWGLSEECEARREPADAAFWGKRALALSPFSESEVQRVLRLLDRVGDLAGALRAYHGLQKSLETEFGAQPSTETARLAADITKRLESGGQRAPALFGTQRSGADRRVTQRRRSHGQYTGVERRSLSDRRQGPRRSGLDRRAKR